MAIYHFSVQILSRAKGQSSVAAASYRSGEALTETLTGETKFYPREVKPETMILTPAHAPKWVKNRQHLWNEVEQIEKRKDAQLAREFNVALPIELDESDQRKLIERFVENECVKRGMIADMAIHRDAIHNPHAHIMLTTRTITKDGFGKKNREWNHRSMLQHWRKTWTDYVNEALKQKGIQDRITHQSYQDRALEILPTIHLGYIAHQLEQKGFRTDRGDINRERQAYNQTVLELAAYQEEKSFLIEEAQKEGKGENN
ncbi:MobQ family relaxase [Alkalihalobacillus sp. TS-13]|uniref:MobQ family relaxase n=1 Tax=Alkalihalobacillus sp. TS-13 TaxID=2842455 RepID=UPI001C8741E2|nr:MobQ family relaxase [Alkalihalobacillus sp. TS-13]